MKPELAFTYDAEMRPIAGNCTVCGEQMPAPPSDPDNNVDAVLWISHHFLIHKQIKHPALVGSPADDTDSRAT